MDSWKIAAAEVAKDFDSPYSALPRAVAAAGRLDFYNTIALAYLAALFLFLLDALFLQRAIEILFRPLRKGNALVYIKNELSPAAQQTHARIFIADAFFYPPSFAPPPICARQTGRKSGNRRASSTKTCPALKIC